MTNTSDKWRGHDVILTPRRAYIRLSCKTGWQGFIYCQLEMLWRGSYKLEANFHPRYLLQQKRRVVT